MNTEAGCRSASFPARSAVARPFCYAPAVHFQRGDDSGPIGCSSHGGSENLLSARNFVNPSGPASTARTSGNLLFCSSVFVCPENRSMLAMAITQFGPPQVLQPVTLPDPTPGPGEVLIRVLAAGVARADVLQRKGQYLPPPGASEIPGLDAAGVIEEVG